MRPVNRGNPTNYPIDYMAGGANTSQAVIDAIDEWQDAIDLRENLAAQIEVVETAVKAGGGKLTAGGTNKRKGGASTTTYTLPQIVHQRIALTAAYNSALTAFPIVVANLEAAGLNLIENYNQEISSRLAEIETGTKKIKAVYPTSRKDLIVNLGQYCSYCEMPLATSLAVEHMLPKAGFPLKSVSWDNFLLACPICNSLKNDKPSRATGIAAAISAGNNPPTTVEIQDAARDTYLWPSDSTNYANWQTHFKYQMKKVIYDKSGRRISSQDIPAAVVNGWGFGATQAKIIQDTGYAVEVQFIQWLADVQFDFNAVLAGLQGDTVHQTLQDTIGQLNGEFQLDFNNPVTVTLEQPNVWQLQTIQTYRVNTLTSRAPQLSSVDGGQHLTPLSTFNLSQKEGRAFLSNLGRGVLPDEVKNFLAGAPYWVDPINQQALILKVSGTIFDILVIKRLNIVNDNDLIRIYSLQQYQVEAHVTEIGGGAQAKARQVINDITLNRVKPADNKVSDRRMVKRTRTWFIALDAVRSINAIVGFAGFNPPGEDLWQLIVQTAVATGYWSVWWSVLNTFVAAPYRKAFTDFLLLNTNFPGTR